MTASPASNIRAHRGARRALVAAAISATAVLGLTACGAGQITQTATQIAAVNGGETTSGDIALRNVQLLYPTDSSTPTPADEQIELTLFFVALNNSADTPDTLERITIDGREVAVQAISTNDTDEDADTTTVGTETAESSTEVGGGLVLAPHRGLSTPLDRFEGVAPDESFKIDEDKRDNEPTTRAPQPVEDVAEITGLQAVSTEPVDLGDQARAGNVIDVTFHFERAGEITLPVPISAVHDAPRLQSDENDARNMEYQRED